MFCLQVLLLQNAYSQVIPKGMNYQAVAKDLKGNIIPNEKISLKIYLFSNESNLRTNYYSEIHEITTNNLGLFNLVIGEGNENQGNYGLVPWNTENIWLEVALKDKDRSVFNTVSNSKLMAVPYAIYARTTDHLTNTNQTQASFSPPEPGVISNSWSVFGNAKTDAAGNPYRVNSLGTTDKVDLILITDNIERMRILSGGDIITKLNFEIGKNLTVDQNLFVIKSTNIGDSLLAKKNVLLNTIGGSTINYGPFTVANASPTHLTGRLTVDRSVDLDSTLTVDGPTDLNGRLFVNNMSPTKLSGTLQVDSAVNINDALFVNNMSPTILSGTLRVDSCATFLDTVKIVSTYSTDTSGIAPSGSLQVGGGTYVQKNLYVGGIAKFGGPAVFGGAVSITDGTQSINPMTGALRVSGGVGIGLNLNVGGMAMIGGMTTIKDNSESTDSTNGALKVLGGIGIRKNLNIGINSTFGKNLNVEGISYFNNDLSVMSSSNYVAHFKNTSNQNGIYIEITNPQPGHPNNFISFRNTGNTIVGRIEGDNASEYKSNPEYLARIDLLSSAVTQAELKLAVSSIQLAGSVAGLVAAAASTTTCAGLGFCQTVPIISLIIKAGLDVAAYGILVATGVVSLNATKDRKSEYIAYKDTHIGISYASGAGDYAEWLPKSDINETFSAGQIVGLMNGTITKDISNANKLLVISTQPIVLGNMKLENQKDYEKVAFIGQVPVKVIGKVNEGEYILPNGKNDGIGVAKAASEMAPEDFTHIVGIAWTSSSDEGVKNIMVATGLNDGEINGLVSQNDILLNGIKSKFSQSNMALTKLLPAYSKINTSFKSNFSENKHLEEVQNQSISTIDYSKINSNQFSLLGISTVQVSELMDEIETQVKSNNPESKAFWDEMKSNEDAKESFIKEIQGAYKKEIEFQLNKWMPVKN